MRIRTHGPLRNGIMLAGASCANVLLGLLASKIWAVSVGPGGLGRAAAIQALVSLAAACSGLALGSAVVKHGAELAAQPDRSLFRTLIRAAWSIWQKSAIIGVAALLTGGSIYRYFNRQPVSLAADDLFVACALAATTASGLAQGVISASRRVALQAACLVLGALSGHVLSVLCILWGGASVIGLAICLNYSGMLFVSLILSHRVVAQCERPDPPVEPDSAHWRATLLQTGLPLALANLVGGGVQSALPLLVSYQLGDESAGLLRASSLLAFHGIGILMITLSHDYFPRLSAVRLDTAAVLALLRQQFRFMLGLGVLITSLLAAVAPWLLTMCFSERFVEGTRLLDLLAIGTILKMGSWCLAYVVLARCSSRVYLLTEGVTGLFWLLTAVAFTSLWGLDGIGYSFVLTYLAYGVLVAAIVARDTRSLHPWSMLLAGIAGTIPVIGIIGLRAALGAVS